MEDRSNWTADGRPVVLIGAGNIDCSLWWFGCFVLSPPEELCVQMHVSAKTTTVEGRMFEFVVLRRLDAPSTSDQHLHWRLPNFDSLRNCRAETENRLIIMPSGIREEWCLWGWSLWENRGVACCSLVNGVWKRLLFWRRRQRVLPKRWRLYTGLYHVHFYRYSYLWVTRIDLRCVTSQGWPGG